MRPKQIKKGRFPDADENDAIRSIVKHLEDGASDWVQQGGYIGVRCHEDPRTYRFVVAKIVHETEDVTEKGSIR